MPAEPGVGLVIRPYRPGDEGAILELFARSFHVPRSVEHWNWKFRRNPFGNERISLALNGEERLVGHYASYVVPYHIDGNTVEAHQIGDTMTDPSVRHIGKGPTSVLGRTALHFYANFCEGRVAFNYGFNVANIQKFSLRFLRSDRVEPVSYRYRDLGQKPLKKLGRAERLARGYQLELATHATVEWDEFFARVAKHYGFLVQRDARYVQWRYFDRPDVSYAVVAIRKWRRLVGWVVVRVRENSLVVGDALIDPDHADALEIALRHLAAVSPVESMEGWFPPRPGWLAPVLSDLFDSRPEPQDLSLMCVPFLREDAVPRMRQSLYYTLADSDLF